MKITVLGGSPKGDVSITMQYVRYLEKRYPETVFRTHQTAQPIRKLEKNREAFDAVINDVRDADAVLFAFPLYYMAASSQYHRFLELVEERDAVEAFEGKYAAALTTSIHFYDHTAIDFIREVAEDWGMPFVDALPAQMNDLRTETGRNSLEGFYGNLRRAVSDRLSLPRRSAPRSPNPPFYTSVTPAPRPIASGRRTVVVTDGISANLGAMVERYRSGFAEGEVEVIDLSKARIAGGCLGCLKCGPKNECAYDGKDDVREIFQNRVMTADAVVYAVTVPGRFYSSRFKNFVDRCFFRTHQSSINGKPFAWLVAGGLKDRMALREVLLGWAEMQKAVLVDIVTDEPGDPGTIDAHIDGLVRRTADALVCGYRRPGTFRYVGGVKLFRDDVSEGLKLIFRQDHQTYRKTGVYDRRIPKALRSLGTGLAYALTGIPFINRKMMEGMRRGMTSPFQKALALAEAKGREGTAAPPDATARKAG